MIINVGAVTTSMLLLKFRQHPANNVPDPRALHAPGLYGTPSSSDRTGYVGKAQRLGTDHSTVAAHNIDKAPDKLVPESDYNTARHIAQQQKGQDSRQGAVCGIHV